jgi:hypothetical protein
MSITTSVSRPRVTTSVPASRYIRLFPRLTPHRALTNMLYHSSTTLSAPSAPRPGLTAGTASAVRTPTPLMRLFVICMLIYVLFQRAATSLLSLTNR